MLLPGSERFEFEGKVYAGYKDVANFWDMGAEPKPVPLRKDFDAPNAQFVLATGSGNPGREGFGLQIAETQLAVGGDKGKYPEFKGNVKAVDTRDLWREADMSPVNQGHHENHNAETYYETGERLGRAMAELRTK